MSKVLVEKKPYEPRDVCDIAFFTDVLYYLKPADIIH